MLSEAFVSSLMLGLLLASCFSVYVLLHDWLNTLHKGLTALLGIKLPVTTITYGQLHVIDLYLYKVYVKVL